MKPMILIASLLFGVVAIGGGVRAKLADRGASAALSYYGDGAKKNSTEYVDGVKHGSSEQWYHTGQSEWTGAYRDGFRDGPWLFWNEDGSVDQERSGRYEAGRRVGD